MKPVMMTHYRWPEANCFAACMASILELPIEEMPAQGTPALKPGEEVDAWLTPWNEWLAQRGLRLMSFGWDNDAVRHMEGYTLLSCRVLGAKTMPDGTELRHVVVALDGKIVHDPQPGDNLNNLWPDYYMIFVALNPAKVRA